MNRRPSIGGFSFANSELMQVKENKIELLAPAGNFEKLEIAVAFGADAVYLGGKDFSLRNFSGNFTIEELRRAVEFAHRSGVKVYVACNIYPRNHELEPIAAYLEALGEIGPDAVIAADPGIIEEARKRISGIPLHLSTQANVTSVGSALFWKRQGIDRINAARELSLDEIRELVQETTMPIEAFVHGAMCIAYSGRCLLSSFLTDRDGNRGMCSQPCRWKYTVMEETRPGQHFPFMQDERGSYIFNSRDLCMIEHLPELIQTGICALKIEGRMKGIHYVATTVKAYREAIDAYHENSDAYQTRPQWIEELGKVTERGHCTGFYLKNPEQTRPNYSPPIPWIHARFAGKAIEPISEDLVAVFVRNKIIKGDAIEILSPRGPIRRDRILEILNGQGCPMPHAQPNTQAVIRLTRPCGPNDLFRTIHDKGDDK